MPTVGLKSLTLTSRVPGVGRGAVATTPAGQEIQKRIAIGQALIEMVENEKDDPRAPDVVDVLNEQLAELESRLAMAEGGKRDG